MKKLLSILLVLALTLCALAIPALADTYVASNVKLTPVRAKFVDYGGDDAIVRVYMRVVNDNNFPITILASEIMVDGVSIQDTGITNIAANSDTGADSSEYFLFEPKTLDDAAAANALRSARSIRIKMHCYNSDNHDDLFSDTFTIDITEIDDIESTDYSDTYDDSSSDTSYSSSSNNSPAYTPASYDFKTLSRGSRGQAVKDLQQRLTDLGYLNDKVDGVFGLNTGTAVMSFKYQHGMAINSDATPEMQQLLYSTSAQHYEEPWIPLVIGPEYKWYNPKDALKDVGTFYTHLVNRSHRDIRGYELYFYQTDIWGNKIYDDDGNWLHKWDFVHTIKSGYLEYSQTITIYPFAYTYSVWVGVHKIAFSDGEVREIDPDEIIYFECPVKN